MTDLEAEFADLEFEVTDLEAEVVDLEAEVTMLIETNNETQDRLEALEEIIQRK